MRVLPVVLLAGLAIVPLAGASAADWSKARKVGVVASEYKFVPRGLTFHQGVAYRLHIENRGSETHEFTAPEFFKAIQPRDMKPLNADHTEIVVQPGQHAVFYFVAGAPGRFKLTCSDHGWAGMTGDITIVP